MADTIRIVVLLLIGLYAVYLLTRSAKAICFLFALVGPYAYFSISLGFVITPAKMLALIALLSLILFPKSTLYDSRSRIVYFIPYFAYIVALTVFMFSFWPEFTANSQGLAYSNNGRAVVQLFQLLLGTSLILLLVRYIKTWEDVEKLLSITLLSMLIIGLWGFYIYIAQRYGLPFPRIARADGSGTLNVISTEVGGQMVMRAYSLSGEPKGLASDMVLGIAILAFVPLRKKPYLIRMFGSLPSFFMMLLVLFLTYSTAGMIIFPIAMCIGGIIYGLTGLKKSKLVYLALAVLPLVCVLAFTEFGGHIIQAITYRLFDRVGDGGVGGYAEDAMDIVWSNNPLRLLFGAGLGGANFYIREVDPLTYAGKIAAPRGLYGFLADRGILGLSLYGIASFMCLRSLWRAIKIDKGHSNLIRGVLVFLVIGNLLLLTKQGWYFEWLLVGLTIACANICLSSQHNSRVSS